MGMLLYIEGFWWIICRKWGIFDNWRIRKYMYLVRVMYNKILEILITRSLKKSLCQLFSQQLISLPLNGKKEYRGICNYLFDIMLEELNKVVLKNKNIKYFT